MTESIYHFDPSLCPPDNKKETQRIRALEEMVKGLRMSRRLLMDLFVAQEKEKNALIAALQRENRRLRKSQIKMERLLDRPEVR